MNKTAVGGEDTDFFLQDAIIILLIQTVML